MSLFKKKSALERKIDEIEKEAERIRNTIKVLDRAVKKGEDIPLRPIPSSKTPRQPAARPAQPQTPVQEKDDGEIFGLQKQRPAIRPPTRAPKAVPSRPPKRAAPIDHKFASYLTSGSFVPATPMREDKSVQRNKAIFMIVIVAVVAFILYSLFKHF